MLCFATRKDERPTVAEIEAFELLEPLRKIEASGRYETALNTLAFAGRVFRYAVATGRAWRDVEADPRPGELRLADWSEFDLDAATWRIPAARTKMRKEHLIPILR